jgi:ubiquinone/menaquinone biosynthesis C-methylase UbiE
MDSSGPHARGVISEIEFVAGGQTRCVTGGVDYNGPLATAYDAGRRLSVGAETTWIAGVSPYVQAQQVVVDVGAGTGRFARLFAERFDAEVVAVEPAHAMRAVGARSGADRRVRWVAGRAEALPLRNSVADVIWLCCVVHYLDLTAAGHDLARVLAPGGTLLVRSVFPDRFDELEWLRWFPGARAIDEERMPSVAAIADAWTSAGLVLQARRPSTHLAADDLRDLADRIEHRAISTLRLISDDEFATGLAALRADARKTARAPVYSPVDVLVFAPRLDG